MTYVSVNVHNIQANAKHGRNDPPIREIKSVGRATAIYSPDCLPLKCGARMVN